MRIVKKITGGRWQIWGEAPRGWGLGGVSLSPIRVGSGEGAVPPPQKFFLTFWLKIVHLGVYSDKNSQFSIE